MQKPTKDHCALANLRKETYRLLYDFLQVGRFKDEYQTINILNAFERQRRSPLTLRIRNHRAVYCVLYSLSCANQMRIEQSFNQQWFDRQKIASQQHQQRFDRFYLKKA